MKTDRLTRIVLSVIAVSLFAIALHSYTSPPTVFAESSAGYPFYVEPGTAMLRAPDGSRQVYGKVMIDMRTGDIWGFPTLTQDPYPVNGAKSTPPVSHPFLLGKFALADVDKLAGGGGE